MNVWLDAFRSTQAVTGTDRIAALVVPRLCERLRQRGVTPWVSARSDDEALCGAAKAAGARVVRRRAGQQPPRIGSARLTLLRELFVRPGAYLSFHNLHASSTVGAPTIVSIYDVIPLEAKAPYVSAGDEAKLRERWRRNVRRATAVVHISEASLDAARRELGAFDAKPFYTPCATMLDGRPTVHPAELGLGPEASGFVLVHGGAEPRKDVRVAIAAHRQLAPDLRASFPLVVLGGAWRDVGLEQLPISEEDPFVRLCGHVEEGRYGDIVASARCALCPSRLEGFDIPLLDAMRFGVPVVASDIAAHREVAGTAAAWSSPGDVSGFARALSTALTDASVRQHHIEAGRETASRFTVERCVDGYEAAVLHALRWRAGST